MDNGSNIGCVGFALFLIAFIAMCVWLPIPLMILVFLWFLYMFVKAVIMAILYLFSLIPNKKHVDVGNEVEDLANDNRFVFWHKRLDEKEETERKMNDALQSIEDKKESEKSRKYQEYLDWCEKNNIAPRFSSENEIDHCY